MTHLIMQFKYERVPLLVCDHLRSPWSQLKTQHEPLKWIWNGNDQVPIQSDALQNLIRVLYKPLAKHYKTFQARIQAIAFYRQTHNKTERQLLQLFLNTCKSYLKDLESWAWTRKLKEPLHLPNRAATRGRCEDLESASPRSFGSLSGFVDERSHTRWNPHGPILCGIAQQTTTIKENHHQEESDYSSSTQERK